MLFDRLWKEEPDAEHDMQELNFLPADVKLQIVKAQKLVDETRKRMGRPGVYLDLTCKTELRNDCRAVERQIGRFQKSRELQKEAETLRKLTVYLKTSSENILHWKFED